MSTSRLEVKPAAKADSSPLEKIKPFQKALISWFKKEGKSYPWRETEDPWAILVSEIMLQQTQISTVLGTKKTDGKKPAAQGGHYSRFMALYPTARDMAESTEQEILKAWEGLGYYRRARNLHAAARAITGDHHGVFPRKYDEIRALPGIGQYTAGAVASFAYNESQPIVDANVARVFSRLFNFQERIDNGAGNKQLWQWATQLLPAKNARSYNSALMELGQTYCSNKSPSCMECPVSQFCLCSSPEVLPIKKTAAKITRTNEFAIFAQDSHGRILLQQQQEGKRREGMWSIPRRKLDDTLDLALCLKTTYSITRYHVTLRVYTDHTADADKNEEWHTVEALEELPMPSPDRRALESILA